MRNFLGTPALVGSSIGIYFMKTVSSEQIIIPKLLLMGAATTLTNAPYLAKTLFRKLWRISTKAVQNRQPQSTIIKDRIRQGFRTNKDLTNSEAIAQAIKRGNYSKSCKTLP